MSRVHSPPISDNLVSDHSQWMSTKYDVDDDLTEYVSVGIDNLHSTSGCLKQIYFPMQFKFFRYSALRLTQIKFSMFQIEVLNGLLLLARLLVIGTSGFLNSVCACEN